MINHVNREVIKFKTTFSIISNHRDIPFDYERMGNGLFSTFADENILEVAEGDGLIKIQERNVNYLKNFFRGPPEVVLNGHLKIITPSSGETNKGEFLEEVKIGTFKCKYCDAETFVEQEKGKYAEPLFCDNCQRKGQFKPLFPKDLMKPAWKLPYSALECSAWGVYEDVYNFIKEYLILKENEYHIMTLWILATWIGDDFNSCGYLLFVAPKESGKSQAMQVLHHLAYRALVTVSVTPSSLFRGIELWKMTLLIDEAEYQVRQDTESGQALYGCLNGGYKRGSYALRTEGESRIPMTYDVYGFKAIASTKIFLPTLESRSIIINMTQGKPKEILIDEDKGTMIRSKLLYFRFSTLGKLKRVQPKSTSGRLIEMFTSLYTTAQIFKEGEGIKSVIDHDGLIKILDEKMRELESRRNLEEEESSEALVLNAITEVLAKDVLYSNYPDLIFLKDIANFLGWTKDHSTGDIGRILKGMGIKTKRRMNGTVIEYKKQDVADRIKEMMIRYAAPPTL